VRRALFGLLALFLLLPLGGCGRDPLYESAFLAMDTVVQLRFSREGVSDADLKAAAAECEAIVARIEGAISRTAASSETVRFNASAGGIASSDEDFLAVLSASLRAAEETEGAVSPALGRLTELWNVSGGGYVPTEAELAEARAHCDWRALSVADGFAAKTDAALCLDFGAIGKGYAAARLIEYLVTTGIRWGLVSLGGNVALFGEKPDGRAFRVGLTDPADKAAVAGYLSVPDGFVSVSGDYERYFEADGVRYHHIFDPATGRPAASGLHAAAVWSRDGTLADALSTALFVMGAERALAFYDAHPGLFEAVLIADGAIRVTPGLTEGGFEAAGAYSLIP